VSPCAECNHREGEHKRGGCLAAVPKGLPRKQQHACGCARFKAQEAPQAEAAS
jgi:hypothetical protein